MTPSQQINKLFILANLQENIIMQMDNSEFKQLAKQQFNKSIREIKRLNRFINDNLNDQEIEGIDNITDEVNNIFNKY